MSEDSAQLVLQLVKQQNTIIDVRAPKEFAKGHLPHSINMPILDDEERHQVGLMYKREGQAAATKLGHKLVSGSVKQDRISRWSAQYATTPNCRIMCWRGGQRSSISQQWLSDQGVQIERINGGYKILRQGCLHWIDQAAQQKWIVIGGKTGVGKTKIIHACSHSIDLEHRAHHRGSAFGRFVNQNQPSQASFENQLVWDYLSLPQGHIVVEDESRTIGRTAVPEVWFDTMQQAPVVQLEASLEERITNIAEEYVHLACANHGVPLIQSHLSQALQRISRRLGGALFKELTTLMEEAFYQQRSHSDWIETLLVKYYDPMYEYQLTKKQQRIIFAGDHTAVQDYLDNLSVS